MDDELLASIIDRIKRKQLPERHELLAMFRHHKALYEFIARRKAEGATPQQVAEEVKAHRTEYGCFGFIAALLFAGMLAEAITSIWDLIEKFRD